MCRKSHRFMRFKTRDFRDRIDFAASEAYPLPADHPGLLLPTPSSRKEYHGAMPPRGELIDDAWRRFCIGSAYYQPMCLEPPQPVRQRMRTDARQCLTQFREPPWAMQQLPHDQGRPWAIEQEQEAFHPALRQFFRSTPISSISAFDVTGVGIALRRHLFME